MNKPKPLSSKKPKSKLQEYCEETSAMLGYDGPDPIGFWIGVLHLYLSKERPENHHIRLNVPLTPDSEDLGELSGEFARFLGDNGDALYRYTKVIQ